MKGVYNYTEQESLSKKVHFYSMAYCDILLVKVHEGSFFYKPKGRIKKYLLNYISPLPILFLIKYLYQGDLILIERGNYRGDQPFLGQV